MLRLFGSLYVTDSVQRVKDELAGSVTTPRRVLLELAFDQSDEVRLKVARNPRTPPDVLKSMKNDSNAAVRDALPSGIAGVCTT